jgi:hypothetical protein
MERRLWDQIGDSLGVAGIECRKGDQHRESSQGQPVCPRSRCRGSRCAIASADKSSWLR